MLVSTDTQIPLTIGLRHHRSRVERFPVGRPFAVSLVAGHLSRDAGPAHPAVPKRRMHGGDLHRRDRARDWYASRRLSFA